MNKKKAIAMILVGALCMSVLSGCGKTITPADTSACNGDIQAIQVSDEIKIVGLGEASHGVSEYHQMKAEVFKALVANNGCRSFIIEGDFGGSLKVDEYIHGGSGTAQEAVGEIGFAIYRTQEMADLVEWMRNYNESATEEADLHFYGMDMQRYDNNKDYLFQVLETGAPELSEKYEELFAELTDEKKNTLDNTILKEGEEQAQALLGEMDNMEVQLVEAVGQESFDFARECANSIYECSKLCASGTDYSTLRDGFMADKVNWFVEHGDGSVLFINSHNGHIGKVSAYGYKCLGALLAEQYGEQYFAIATDANETCFNSQTDNGFTVMTVKNRNDLTALTQSLDMEPFYLDFAAVEGQEDWQQILTSSQKMTVLNVGIAKWQQMISAMYTKNLIPVNTYNGVIVFDQVHPSTLLQE